MAYNTRLQVRKRRREIESEDEMVEDEGKVDATMAAFGKFTIPSFYPDKTRVTDFLTLFQAVTVAWSEAEKKCALAANVHGKAATWLSNYIVLNPNWSFQDAAVAMRLEFSEDESVSFNRVLALKQKPSQSPVNFFEELHNALLLTDVQIQNKYLIPMLIDAFEEDARSLLITMKTQSLEDLKKNVHLIDGIWLKKKQSMQTANNLALTLASQLHISPQGSAPVKPTAPANEPTDKKDEVSAFAVELSSKIDRLSAQVARSSRSRGRPSQNRRGACFNCGKIGHFAAQCWQSSYRGRGQRTFRPRFSNRGRGFHRGGSFFVGNAASDRQHNQEVPYAYTIPEYTQQM